jgi:ABC-2 type transport system ATP-binding protein
MNDLASNRPAPGTEAPPAAVRDLVKRYGGVTAVDGLTFTLAPGAVTALLGGNGAGKTTTIAMLLGLVTPSAGEVRVFGADMTRERAQIAHRINFESPYMDMPMRLTVRQNLSVYARLYGVRDVAERIAAVAEELQIAALLDRRNGRLSAGQKTRVSLAKALLNAPELLLLDEPTASLDPDTADWVRARLQEYAAARGATILLASHNMAEVERLADRVLIMRAGKLAEDDAPAALVRKYGQRTLEAVFLDIARGAETRRERAP